MDGHGMRVSIGSNKLLTNTPSFLLPTVGSKEKFTIKEIPCTIDRIVLPEVDVKVE